jgi:hypothetical protein
MGEENRQNEGIEEAFEDRVPKNQVSEVKKHPKKWENNG